MQKRLHTQLPKLLLLLALLFGINSFGQYSGTGTFTKINSLAEFTDGYYVIAYSTTSSTQAMNNTNSGVFGNTTISPTGGTTLASPSAAIVWKIETNGTGKSIYNEASQTYVSYNGTGNTAAATTTATTNNQRWSITYSGGLFLFQNLAVTARYLEYNTQSPRFAAYTGTQQDITLYKLGTPTGPSVTTTAATNVAANGATLNGTVNPNGTGATAASFDYGTSTSYGSTATATPASVTGSAATAIAATVAGLTPNTTYHFRAVGNQGSAINGSDQTFLTLANVPGAPIVSNATLTTLSVAIAPNGNPENTTYVIRVVNGGTTQYVQSNGNLGTSEVALAAGTRTISGLANNTAYTFSVKAKNGAGTDTAYSAATTGTTLADTAPSITTGGTIAASTTTYGTASTTKNFTVNSANLTEDVTVTAPAGFEVSLTSGGTYTASVAVAPNTTGTTVYIRLSAIAAAGSYNDKVVTLTSGATTAIKAIANSTVAQKALTISGLTAGTKVYDATRTAPVTGVAVLSGVVNGDAVTLSGTPSFNFADANVGNAKAITITGFALTGAGAQNYTLTLPALTGSITAKAVTIENAAAQNKTYDGSQTAVTTGTLTGVVSPDAVTYTAQFAQATAAENIAVNFTLTGANAGNYTLTQPAVTANITKATPVFTNQPLAIGVGENVVLTNTAFEISNSNGILTYASSNPAVASVNGSTVTGVAVGTATLTITQAEGTNYVAGSTTVSINVTAIAYENGDYRTTSSGTWPAGSSPATWERYSNGSWVSSTAPLANTTANLYIQAPHIITASTGFASGAKLIIKGTFIQNATNNTTSASIHVYDGGTLTVNYNFVNSGEFTVENNGTVIINNASITGISTIWNGTENFKAGSNFIIQNWDYSTRLITSTTRLDTNTEGYYFGNLTIAGAPSSSLGVVDGNVVVKLTENNFTINADGPANTDVLLSNNNANITIGEDLIVSNGTAGLGSNGAAVITVLGNTLLNGGQINLKQTSNGNPGQFATLAIKKNLITASGSTLNSSDGDSKIVFSGTTLQSINIEGTLGNNADFEIASGAEAQFVGQNLTTANGNDFTVLNGGTLAFNNFNLTGAGAFTLAAGGNLKITDAAGVTTTGATGNVRTTGTRTYAAGGNFIYVGSAAPQVTGNAVVNAGTIIIDKTNTGDVVTPSVAIPTLGTIRVNRGVFDAGSTVVGGTATNFTLLANGKYRTSGVGTKPSAAGTYTIDPIATVDFYGTDATNIRTAPNYGIVLVSGTNVGLESATEGLKFNTGGSFEVTNESTFKVANATGFNGGTATAITTTGNPAITLGATSNVVYNGTVGQTITAVNTTDGTGTEGYGNLTVTAPGVSQLGANLVYARNNFTLNGENASLVIETGKTLKVGNQVTENGGTINIENNGALLQVNDVDNTGTINVKKNSNSLYRLDYTMWSSPVSGMQTLTQFSPLTLTNRFYEYGIDNGAEHYISIANTSELFTPAKGYLIRMPDNAPSDTVDNAAYRAGTTPLTFTGTFTGTPNNGEVTIPASTQLKRFTAVGNPYPSPISVTEFYSANSNVIDQGSAIYFWRKRNGANTSAYATLTLAGQTAGYRANRNDVSADQGIFYAGAQNTWLISQGQGFIVKTSATAAAGANITFNNSMRRPAPVTGNQAFYRTAQSSTSRLWLNLTSTTEDFTQMAIAYIDGATTGLDYGYDGKMFGDSNTISLYTIAEDTKLAIQARPVFNASDIVPVGYKSAAAGQFTIELDHTDGVFTQGQNIYLKDNVLNIYHDLSEGDYSFATEAGTFNDRFEVVYSTEALGTTTPQLNANSVIIYKKDNTLSVNAGTAVINSVTVFDIRGRKLASKTGVNATTTVVAGLEVANEILIIEVNTDQGRISKKIVY